MHKAYSVKGDVIILHRDLTALDLFVRAFLAVLKKYSDYLVVSGYVSISTGRTRGTEDVDILVPVMDRVTFDHFFKDLQKNKFWCYQGDSIDEIYPYIKSKMALRFAKVDELFPNIECIPIDETKRVQYFEFKHPQKMKVNDFEFNATPLEFEILYKELVLGSEKDCADAQHLRTLFSELLNDEKFAVFKKIIGGDKA